MGIESDEVYGGINKVLSPRGKKSKSKVVAPVVPSEFTEEEVSKLQVRKWTVFVELDSLMGELIRIKDFV